MKIYVVGQVDDENQTVAAVKDRLRALGHHCPSWRGPVPWPVRMEEIETSDAVVLVLPLDGPSSLDGGYAAGLGLEVFVLDWTARLALAAEWPLGTIVADLAALEVAIKALEAKEETWLEGPGLDAVLADDYQEALLGDVFIQGEPLERITAAELVRSRPRAPSERVAYGIDVAPSQTSFRFVPRGGFRPERLFLTFASLEPSDGELASVVVAGDEQLVVGTGGFPLWLLRLHDGLLGAGRLPWQEPTERLGERGWRQAWPRTQGWDHYLPDASRHFELPATRDGEAFEFRWTLGSGRLVHFGLLGSELLAPPAETGNRKPVTVP